MSARPSEGLRLMAVHAHPDDESSKGAATMARYVSEGAQVMVVSCTGGERGDVLNPSHPPVEPADMPTVRRGEMARAAEALGIEHRWLGFVDSGLPEGDPLPPLPDGCFALTPLEEAAAPLVALVREFRPHVLTTYDPNGGYPHPDHIMTHRVSVEAWAAAADPARYPEAGEPWAAMKLYYDVGFSPDRLRALHDAIEERGGTSPFREWLEHMAERPWEPRPVTTRIHVADHFTARDAALRAHATQIDPDGFFFLVPRDVETQVWPTEEFELAEARIPTSLPEDDLFAGLRGLV